MAGTDDLIAAAMPYMATEAIAATAGESWEWWYDDIVDDAGTLVDLTGCTGVCDIRNTDGALLLTAVVTLGVGTVKVTATPSATAPLATAAAVAAQHRVEITTPAGRKFLLVGAGGTTFIIRAQRGV